MPSDAPEIRVENNGDAVEMRVGNADDKDKVRLLSLHDLDRRTAAYRRTTDLIAQIEADAGGHDHLSTGQRALIQRAAVTAALAEHMETQWLSGEQIDPGLYCTLGNALRRLLETVGLKRVPRELSSADREAIRIYEQELAAP